MKKIFQITYFLFFIFLSCSEQELRIISQNSKFLPRPNTVIIFTPDTYENDKQFPLVILLHGYSGNYNSWNSITDLQSFADEYGFVIACPDGIYNSWYLNSTLIPNLQYEDYFWNDFIPYLENNYSIDKENIFISGLSMGGHGAITLFLKNKDYFKSAGSTSGILDITQFPDNWEINETLGEYSDNRKIWENNSAYHLLDSVGMLNAKIIIDCGFDDFAFPVNVSFIDKAKKHNIDVKFIESSGDHNGEYWARMIPFHFKFFYEQFEGNSD